MRKINIRSVTATALMAALICVSSFITIPFPVPITLQTLGLYFALFALGGRRGSVAVFTYIATGAVGLPVFSGFTGGFSRLFDATGGYIFGFLIAALVFWLMTAAFPDRAAVKIVASAVSLLLLYVAGTLWYALVYAGGIHGIPYILSVCVLPFILPDALKIAVAYALSSRLSRIINI